VGTGGLCLPGCGRAVCVAEVRGGGLRCWGLCVFVIESPRRFGCLMSWLHQVGISLYFMRKMHGQTTLKFSQLKL
jgi:hypothetical protein